MVRSRKYYTSLKDRGISILFVHRFLSAAGVIIPQRTLQYHIDNDFLKCKDDALESKIKLIISEYNNLVTKLV